MMCQCIHLFINTGPASDRERLTEADVIQGGSVWIDESVVLGSWFRIFVFRSPGGLTYVKFSLMFRHPGRVLT